MFCCVLIIKMSSCLKQSAVRGEKNWFRFYLHIQSFLHKKNQIKTLGVEVRTNFTLISSKRDKDFLFELLNKIRLNVTSLNK